MADLFDDMSWAKSKNSEILKLIDSIDKTLEYNTKLLDSVTEDLVDKDFLNEIITVVRTRSVGVFFGKSLRDIKIIVIDGDGDRNHEIFLQYKSSKKIIISHANLPHSSLLTREYRYLDDLIETITKYINDLSEYFLELENIDLVGTIMEPKNASFKDDFRRIYLDDRTWLHVEVTSKGLARNVHLVGQAEHWHNKLQSGLSSWDHDKSIVDNVLTTFDLSSLPKPTTSNPMLEQAEVSFECGICLVETNPEDPGVPQPLCQNITCGVYYHRSCLYQWLVSSVGSRPPAFGVANGACPTCMQPITCSKIDN